MTEAGETDGYTAADHLDAIYEHAPQIRVHDVLLNATPIPPEVADVYAARGALPVTPTPAVLEAKGCRVVTRPLLASGIKLRHDSNRLAEAILDLGVLREDSRYV